MLPTPAVSLKLPTQFLKQVLSVTSVITAARLVTEKTRSTRGLGKDLGDQTAVFELLFCSPAPLNLGFHICLLSAR